MILALGLAACGEFKVFDGGNADASVDVPVTDASETAVVPDTVPADLPATCIDIRRLMPAATDGTFMLYAGHVSSRPWQAYCYDLAGAPAEYLAVANSGATQNFSQYTAGGIGTSVRTVYRRVRIDPMSFRVSTGDQRFAETTGMLDGISSMPYAMAGDCNAAQTGLANIDLRGTPFAVAPDTFVSGGYTAAGNAMYSNNDQVIVLVGGGYCGWMGPRPVATDQATALRGASLPLIYR
jgi:hypothetical protein